MCNKGNTHKNFINWKILILFHTCDLVHSLTVGILQFYINQSIGSYFQIIFLSRVCLRHQGNALLQKRNLTCSMLTINESATPMTLLQCDGSLVQLWEARVPGFSFLKQCDLQHQHNHCKCESYQMKFWNLW